MSGCIDEPDFELVGKIRVANATGPGARVPSRTSGPSTGRDEAPPFEAMVETHRRAGRGMTLYWMFLVAGGIALVVLGWIDVIPWLVGLITGIVAIAVAIFPWREAVERRERVEGLQVLGEEWREMIREPNIGERERQGFAGLLWRLYSSDKSVG